MRIMEAAIAALIHRGHSYRDARRRFPVAARVSRKQVKRAYHNQYKGK